MNGLMIVVGAVAAVVLLLAVLVKLYFCYTGLENIVAKVDSHSAYTVDSVAIARQKKAASAKPQEIKK